MTEQNAKRIEELVALRDKAAQAYYEGEESVDGETPEYLMSDSDFDKIIEELKSLGVEEVPGHGYMVDESKSGLPKIVHEYVMQSLKKVRSLNEIQSWLKNFKDWTVIIQPKYDGLALDLVFNEEGKFVQAATRGDHTKGEDVTSSVKVMMQNGRMPDSINVNGHKGNTHIRGEVYITHHDFNSMNNLRVADGEKAYNNPRNTAPGLLRRTDTQLVKFLSFVAYDTNNYEDDEVEFLDGNGFVTPKAHHYTTATTFKEITEAIELIGTQRFSEFEFDTDGAVIKLKETHAQRENIGSTSTHPRWAVAYKYQEVPLPTVIRAVEWNHNRTGKLTPVAIFDEVVFAGNVKTTRATLANYEKFRLFGFRPGDHMLVIRANGVIPFIVGHDPRNARSEEDPFVAPSFLPTEEFPTHLSPTGKDLLAHKDAPPPLASVIENSVKVLELKGVGISFIEEMISLGRVNHFLDLLTLTHDEIVKLRGVQLPAGETSRSAEVAVEAIQQAFTKPLWRWIAAIGLKFIATSKSPILETRYKSLDELAEAKMVDLVTLERFSGDVHARTIIDSSETIKTWADRLRADHNFEPKPEAVAEIKESTGDIDYNGKVVVVTGTFPTMSRKAVEQWIKDHGGKIASSVSASTDILVYGEKAGSKLAKAESVGTKTLVKAVDFENEA